MVRYFFLLFIVIFISAKSFAQDYFTGLVFDDNSYLSTPAKISESRGAYEKLPKSASLKKYCPKPGNQIQFGTSVAWATSWGARTVLEAKMNNWTNADTITKNAFSPIFSYQLVRSDDDEFCTQGSKLDEVLVKMKNEGAVKYLDYLEFCPKDIPPDLLKQAESKKISDFVRLFEESSSAKSKINSVKKSLYEGFPVVIGMYCPPSFFNAKEFWQPKEIINNKFPGHALCVIAYDDELYGGSFQVLNSWGRSWGDQGFTWIQYEDFVEFTKYAYEIFLIDKYSRKSTAYSGSAQLYTSQNQELPLQLISSGIYKLSNPIHSGEKFRLNLSDFSPGYLYIIGTDETNSIYRVFPFDDTISPSIHYQSNNFSIPDDHHYIQMTGQAKGNKLYALFSMEPLNLDFILSELEEGQNIDKEIHALMGNKLLNSSSVSWGTNSLSFSSNTDPDKVLLFSIQFN